MKDTGKIFETLVHLAVSNGVTVRFAPLQASRARLKNNRIALSESLGTIDEINYNLAHELAHKFLHYDKGETFTSGSYKDYEEQADRAAKMLLEALAVI